MLEHRSGIVVHTSFQRTGMSETVFGPPPNPSDEAAVNAAVERIARAGVFDLPYYCTQIRRHCDLQYAVRHYVSEGELAGLTPHVLFQPSHVLEQLTRLEIVLKPGGILETYLSHPDVLINPHALFDMRHYVSVADMRTRRVTCLEHYAQRQVQKLPTASPNLLFDRDYYRQVYLDIAQSDVDEFAHYVRRGWREKRRPHPLVDPEHWSRSLRELGLHEPQECPLTVYWHRQDTWRASPHPLFDPAFYAGQIERLGVRQLDVPPLADMLQRRPQVSCHYLFDVRFYLDEALRAGIDVPDHALLHYLKQGPNGRLDPHPLLCRDFYLAGYRHVGESKITALEHYVRTGRHDDRDPHPLFSVGFYRDNCRQRGSVPDDVLESYLAEGGRNLLDPHPLFEARIYAAHHPSCLVGDDTPLAHYVRSWSKAGLRSPPWGTAIIPRRGAAGAEAPDVIFVSHELTQTGAPLILLRLVEDFAHRRGLRSITLAVQGGDLLERLSEFSWVIPLPFVREAGLTIEAFLATMISSFGRTGRPRLVVVNTACVDNIAKPFAAANLPVITLVHELASAFDESVFRNIYASSGIVIYPAHAVRNEAHSRFDLDTGKTMVLGQGLLDLAFGRIGRSEARRVVLEESGAPADAFIVLGCGTLDLRKGIDLFIQLAAHVVRAARQRIGLPPVQFVWLGGGPTHRHSPYWFAQQDIGRLDLIGNIAFLGARDRPAPYFAGSDAFVLTSRMDPFPCVVMEALACAKPVVAFQGAGGTPEILDEAGGWAVPYGDVAAMADIIVRLAADENLTRSTGLRGQELIHTKYKFTDYADKIAAAAQQRLMVNLPAHEMKPRHRVRRGRFVLPASRWPRNARHRLLAALIRGLSSRGLDAHVVLTHQSAADDLAGHDLDMPLRFLQTSFRHPISYQEKWRRLVAILDNGEPTLFMASEDPIAAAVTPILPRTVGVLGSFHADTPENCEQVLRLGRYWQRAVAPSERLQEKLATMLPTISGLCVVIPDAVSACDPITRHTRDRPLAVIADLPADSGPDARAFLRAIVTQLLAANLRISITLITPNGAGAGIIDACAGSTVLTARAVIQPPDNALHSVLAAGHVFIRGGSACAGSISLPEVMRFGLVPLCERADPWHCGDIMHGQTGYLLNKGDATGFVSVLERLVNDTDELDRLRRAAVAAAEACSSSVEQMCDAYADLCSRMLGELATGGHVRPRPPYLHPSLGGISLPPRLQYSPDDVPAARQLL